MNLLQGVAAVVFCYFPFVLLLPINAFHRGTTEAYKLYSTSAQNALQSSKAKAMFQNHSNDKTESTKRSNYAASNENASPAIDKCNLNVSEASKGHFRHEVSHGRLNFVFARLKFSPEINVTIKEFVVDGFIWTWTYNGENGGFRFLTHPPESSIWSLNLLHESIGGIIETPVLKLQTNGCKTAVEIGNETSSYKIGHALQDILSSLYDVNEDYRANFWCYWERRYVKSNLIYVLCLHVVCPLPSIQYRCCAHHFTPKTREWNLDCSRNNTFVNDFIWYIPFISGCLMFLNMPLFVFWFAWRISSETDSLPSQSGYQMITDESEDGLLSYRNELIFLTEENAVTLFKALFSPCIRLVNLHPVLSSRLKRIAYILFTLLCIAIQFVLDTIWTLDGFVSSCVETGVPMGFRSLRVGYAGSKQNFLRYLGGPVIALSFYTFISFAFIVLPVHLPTLLENGLSKRKENEECSSPLLLSNDVLQQLSSIQLSTRYSYRRIVDYFQMHMFCILNYRFWVLSLLIQRVRFVKLRNMFLQVLLFLPYVIFCFMETTVSFLYYGLPLFVYMKLTLKAFIVRMFKFLGESISNPEFCFIFRTVSLFIITCAWVLQSFLFCTIFLDAVVFISRIFVYSYEGIVLYPKTSYGYIIFIVTVIYYIVKTKNEFSKYYQNILKRLIKIGIKKKAVYIDGSYVVKRQGEYKGVPIELFDAVVERIKPRRVKVFTSLVKIMVIVFIASMTTLLMLHMNKFNHIDVLVHVGTTLFICALPKLIEQITDKYNRHNKKLDEEIGKVLDDFVYSNPIEIDDESCRLTEGANSSYSMSIPS